MATQYRYSSAQLAPGTTGSAASFGNLPVNFSGQTINGSASAFSVAGWVRMRLTPTVGQTFLVFAAEGQFQIEINSTGILAAGFAGNAVRAQTTLPINDGAWHFVAASYQETTPGTNAGTVSLFLDGLPVDSESVVLTGTTQPGACVLGKNINFMDFAAWCIWSAALSQHFLEKPLFGRPPAGGLADTSLVGAWDFANGPATDISGKNLPVQVSQQNWFTPALSGSADASVDIFNIPHVNQSPFTVMLWCFVPSGLTSEQFLFTYSKTPTGGSITDNGTLITVQAATNSRVGATFTFNQDEALDVFNFSQVGAGITTNAWHHLAFVYDHDLQTFTQYIDGSQVSQVGVAETQNSTGSTNSLQLGAPGILTQAISFWNTPLTLAQVQQFMSNDPTGAPSCSGYYGLITDLSNSLTGNSGNPAASSVISEQVVPLAAGDEIGPLVPAFVADPSCETPIMQLEDYRALVDTCGIEIPADVVDAELDALLEPEYQALGRVISKSALAQLRTQFHRDLFIGRELRKRGIRVGVFSSEIQGDERVWFYHTVNGAQEIDRIPAEEMDEFRAGTMTIIIDVIAIFAAVFGIATNARAISDAATKLPGPVLRGLTALADGVGNPLTRAGRTGEGIRLIGSMITMLFTMKAIGSLIWNIFTGSWWSLFFTIPAVLANLVAIFASGTLLLAARILLIGVALGQLLFDLFGPGADEDTGTEGVAAAPATEHPQQQVAPAGTTYV